MTEDYLEVMEQNIKDDYFFECGVNEEIPLRNTNNARAKANKCNQCKYESSSKSTLKRHPISHSGEKPNKCDQCNYACSQASTLRIHLKTHSREKSNKC